MPNLNYNNGRAFEYRVRDHFKKEGYEVFRMAGSHSQADLICIAATSPDGVTVPEVKLVQCKGKRQLMTKQQKAVFFEYCHDLGAEGILAYSHKRKLVLECATSARQELNAPIALNPVS
jgi:Holliday junction resolvase